MESFSLVLLILTVAENMLNSLLITSFLSLKIRTNKFFLLFLSATLLGLFLRTLPVTPLVIIVFLLFIYTFLLKKLYGVSYFVGGLTALLTYVIYVVFESTLIPLTTNLIGADLKYVLSQPLLRLLLFIPQGTAMLLLSFILRHYRINLNNYFDLFNMKELESIAEDEIDLNKEKKISRTMYLTIVFLIVQGLFIVTTNWTNKFFPIFKSDSIFNSKGFINIMVITMTIFLLWLISSLVSMLKIQQSDMVQRVRAKHLSRLSWELRMQYHDFNHHLGMIYMMLKMNKVKEAQNYLKAVVDELETIEEIIKSGNKSLNALLYSKIARGRKKGVKIKVNVVKPLSELSFPDWDLVRIMGNLLDNAIEALEKKEGEKRVDVLIVGGEVINKLEVKTVGIIIPSEIEENIFERGYSSKEGEGRGLGLAICKELVDRYDGSIHIERDLEEKSTSFIVKVF